MVRKKEDKELAELFKDVLDDVEIMPSSSFERKLMKRVRIKEFFNFYPSKFNVWYVGMIAAVATAVALFFIPDKQSSDLQNSATVEIIAPAVVHEIGNNLIEQPDSIVNSLPRKTDNATQLPVDPQGETVELLYENVPVGDVKQIAENGGEEEELVVVIQPEVARQSIIQPAIKGITDNSGLAKSLDEPLFIASSYHGCAPLKVNFTLTDTTGNECRWSFGDGGYSSDNEPAWIFDEEGDYTVTLKLLDNGNVVGSYSSAIAVYPKPLAHFEVSPENAILPDDNITFLNYSTGAVEYRWSFGDGSVSELFEPTHSYLKYGNYDVRLAAISEYGCIDSLVVNNAFEISSYYINFPNAFMPNLAGQSGGYYLETSSQADKVFHPVAYGVATYQLKVFSRVGVLLFESNSLEIGWDGYYKNRLCEPGVYVWKVRGTYLNGEPFTKIGDVTIINTTE